jgi:predicted nucleic acid-binding protein
VKWLFDTNVLSELRKGERCHPGVARWADGISDESRFTSVLVIGEIRRGIERLRRKDVEQAKALGRWLEQVRRAFAGRLLDVTEEVHGLTLVTRNTADFAALGVPLHNPFED